MCAFPFVQRLFNTEINGKLNEKEFACLLEEFRNDYNQKHFVRDPSFPEAAKDIEGDTRKIFIEFLERSCTAEFSGFLLYKALGRRLKKTNPVVAEIFTLMSRDEARHAGKLDHCGDGCLVYGRRVGVSGCSCSVLPDHLVRACTCRFLEQGYVRLRPFS